MKTRLSFVLVLAACGGGASTDIQATLRFADRTDAEISRLVSAASGSEGFQAQATVGSFDNSFDPDPCPNLAISGNTVNITGGCTTMDGVAIEGSASVKNPVGWDQVDYNYGDDSVYELDGLALVQGGTRRSYDGVFIIEAGYTTMDMDVTSELLGVAVRSDVHIACSRTSCNIGGSGVELIGAGGAKVSGTIVISGQTAAATYTLKGLDTVKVTMANNCVSWQLEGTDRGVNPCQR